METTRQRTIAVNFGKDAVVEVTVRAGDADELADYARWAGNHATHTEVQRDAVMFHLAASPEVAEQLRALVRGDIGYDERHDPLLEATTRHMVGRMYE